MVEVVLYNSTVCRLCGEENDNGTLLYSHEENNQSLSELINAYLPLKVSDDGQLPCTICPGCTIQLEATVEFLNLINNGQKIIRQLHNAEKEFKKNLINGVPKDQIVARTNNEKNGDMVYQDDHAIVLQMAGLEKPKRKRGRPPKKNKSPDELAKETAKQQVEKKVRHFVEDSSGKRRRKTPTRFREVIQGKELEKILIEEGVTDGEESDNEAKQDVKEDVVPVLPKEPEVIGHLEDSGELVVVVKGKGRGRPKGRLRPTQQQCAICGAEFSCVGRYMSHVAQHGPVQYQCQQCDEIFATRLLFTGHQAQLKHTGQNVIACESSKKIIPKKESTKRQDKENVASENDTAGNVGCQIIPDLDPLKIEPLEQDTKHEEVTTLEQIHIIPVADLKPDNDEIIVVDGDEEAPQGEDESKDKPKLKCNHCDKVFSSKQSKSLHNKAVHQGEKPYACGECGARFGYPRSLALHSISHRRRAPAKGYACDLCGKVLNHPSSVVYHKEAEHANQRYVCNKCGKSFKHKQLLQRHQLVHSQLRPYSCKTCNASFKTKANLLNHTLLHTGVKKFSCEICKHKFAHKTSLTLHMRWHTGQKPFSCGKCGKSFSQKGNLSEHERIHTGEKPYECTICMRRFTTSSQHRLHARRHGAEKPYTCTSCGKRFSSRASWAAHLRREAGARVFACTMCPRTFLERWALRKHTRRHTGERPHRCPHCPKAFADASNLNKHKKQVHKPMSLLMSEQPPAAAEERVIYVAYDLDEPAYHILDPDQAAAAELDGKVLSTCSLYPEAPPQQRHLPVTDEEGNPLHFTMEDGTQLAITLADGKSLQIVTEDGQTIPVEINRYSEEVEEQEESPGPDEAADATPPSPTHVAHYFTIV